MTAASLEGRVVVVLGGTRGLGRSCAQQLGQLGATVVVTGRSKENAESVANEVRASGAEAHVLVHDVGDVEETRRAIDDTHEKLGRIDGLIANAAKNPYFLKGQDVTVEAWDDLMAVNLRGVFFATQSVGRWMIAAGRGAIVTLSSVTVARGTLGGLPYVAAKGGIEAMTRTLALEWAEHGVRVNCIAPGYIETDMTEGLRHHEGLSALVMGRTPMRRYGTPEEVAGLAVFLLSDAAAYMTAQVIAVDGGLTVG